MKQYHFHRSAAFLSLLGIFFLALALSGCATETDTHLPDPESPMTSAPIAVSPTDDTFSQEQSVPDTTAESTESTAADETFPESPKTKEEFFADALFIGDSRTVGLRDYAELNTATFFAYSGLSSFSAFKKSLEVGDLGKLTLEEFLTVRSFGKIYVMLGINELGYPFSSIVTKYTQVIGQIQQLQPQATILLCANLRVVADGKEVRDYIANDTINQLNAEIAALADGQTRFYIDVNPLFDDGNGALDPQYCTDDLHPYGKYYYQWAEWLYETGIPDA